MIDLTSNSIIEGNEDKVAIIDNSTSWTYLELNKIRDSFYEFTKSNKIVIILGSNNIRTIASYLSCLRMGSVPLLLPDNIKIEQLYEFINRFCPYSLISNQELSIPNSKLVRNDSIYIYIFNKSYSISSNTTALLLTTSGSTGSPKVVNISKENLLSNTKSIIKYLKVSSEERHITTLPMNYTYGLSAINTHLYSSASIILNNESILSSDFWELFTSWKPTTISGVPYTYEMLCRLGLDKLPLNSITKFTQAGGKLSPKYLQPLNKFCMETSKEFFVMYGQTEATARMSYLPPRDLNTKIGSIGIAIPGGSFSLRNKSLYNRINGFPSGELVYKGPNVTLGYAYNCKDLDQIYEVKASLDTGDLAYVDAEGFYYICGRINRFAKISGNRVSLDDIQDLLSKDFTNAVISDDNKIYIYIETIDEINFKEIKLSILKKVNINPILIVIKTIEDLPRSESGKILYKELKGNQWT